MSIKIFLRYGFGLVLAAVFMIPAFYQENASARVVKQVHPHIVLPPPRPPAHMLRNAQFHKWKCTEVIAALKAQGLEAEEVENGLTVSAYDAYESRIFLMPSFGKEVGGLAASYDSEEKIAGAMYYYSSLNTTPELPAWRIFRKDNILLLISGRVHGEKAREYEKALLQMN